MLLVRRPIPSSRMRTALLSFAVCLILPRVGMCASPLLFGFALGGNQTDTIRAVATDSAQNIYVAGETYSANFPDALAYSRITGDAFLVKLNSAGTQILYSLVLGGSGYDSARGIAVDASGNAYITGITSSGDFPTTSGALQRASASPGIEDAFVVKVNAAGAVVYATYLGGGSSDSAYGIAIDATGAAYIAGSTNSVNFPLSRTSPQSALKGGSDCFVAKVDPAGATLVYATYLGGESVDLCKSIAVDSTGAAYVTGTTTSYGFPVVAALDGTLSGGYDAFLTKLSPAGDRFVFSTYLGGEAVDDGNVVRLDSSGNIYVAGDTTSVGFPATSGAYATHSSGNYDGFVCGIASDGSRILFATYLGGSGADSVNDLFVGGDGTIVVAGYTSSADFPVANAFQTSFGGYFDAFVAALGPNGTTLNFSSYLGAGGDDRAYGVAPLGYGKLVAVGQIWAGTVSYVEQEFASGPANQYDGFVAGVAYPTVPIVPALVSFSPVSGSGTSQAFTVGYSSPAGGADILAVQVLINSSLSASGDWLSEI